MTAPRGAVIRQQIGRRRPYAARQSASPSRLPAWVGAVHGATERSSRTAALVWSTAGAIRAGSSGAGAGQDGTRIASASMTPTGTGAGSGVGASAGTSSATGASSATAATGSASATTGSVSATGSASATAGSSIGASVDSLGSIELAPSSITPTMAPPSPESAVVSATG